MELQEFFTYFSFAISCAGIVVGIINRKHILSKCCGRVLEASVVIDNVSPK